MMDQLRTQSLRILVAIVVLFMAAFVLSWIAVPHAEPFFSRLTGTYLIANALPLLVVFILVLCLTLRPISSALWAVSAGTLVVLGSNFKFSIVSQPVLVSDFLLLGQVIGDTELFGNYFAEQWYLVPVALLVVAASTSVFFFERPLTRGLPVRIGLAVFALVAILYLPDWALKQGSVIQHLYATLDLPSYDRNPIVRVRESGLFASLARSSSDLYFKLPDRAQGSSANKRKLMALAHRVDGHPESTGAPNHPDLIVIQNEAFFDFRLIDERFPNEFYAPWDRLKKQAIHGSVQVDTYGGATLRTEFSALTGIPLEIFSGGVDYPYYSIVTYPFNSLPRYLRSLGYRTIAIHPYKATFWDRDRVYPHLGFDEFLSVSAFADNQRDGPYISDAAVCEKVVDVLRSSSQPAYVFVVTMENHGPWSFERGSPDTSRKFDYIKAPANMLAFNRYLYHLGNGMRMAECLIESLKRRERPSTLFFFGDHAPALPKIYKELDLKSPWESVELRTTPFLAWRSWTGGEQEQELHISYLPSFLLGISGIEMNDFFVANAYLHERCETRVKDCKLEDELKTGYAELVYDQFAEARATY
ncbi:MAG: LTA synthase family protein [Acidiferrobacterales bacterium]